MRNIKTLFVTLVAVTVLPIAGRAQFFFQGYAEYGYSIFDYKSDDLQLFMSSYNAVNNPSSPFDMKIPSAKGDYLKFGLGMGEQLSMVLDVCIYKAKSPFMSARFSDGSGRDVGYELRNTISNVGVRWGGTEDMPLWLQGNIDVMIQHVSVKTAWVFPDGTASFGRDHSLNGIYTDFNLIFGLGAAVGFRIAGPLAITASADYIGRGLDSRSHPEYHQYSDNNDVNNDMGYIPRDVAAYNNGAYATENSISNDFRGWKFSFGAVVMLTSE